VTLKVCVPLNLFCGASFNNAPHNCQYAETQVARRSWVLASYEGSSGGKLGHGVSVDYIGPISGMFPCDALSIHYGADASTAIPPGPARLCVFYFIFFFPFSSYYHFLLFLCSHFFNLVHVFSPLFIS
jgi:hypothetical protein